MVAKTICLNSGVVSFLSFFVLTLRCALFPFVDARVFSGIFLSLHAASLAVLGFYGDFSQKWTSHAQVPFVGVSLLFLVSVFYRTVDSFLFSHLVKNLHILGIQSQNHHIGDCILLSDLSNRNEQLIRLPFVLQGIRNQIQTRLQLNKVEAQIPFSGICVQLFALAESTLYILHKSDCLKSLLNKPYNSFARLSMMSSGRVLQSR